MNKNIIGITLGDPCGIGPEVVAKALDHPDFCRGFLPLVIGSSAVFQRALQLIGIPKNIHVIHDVKDIVFDRNIINVFDIPASCSEFPFGVVCSKGGEAAYAAVETAIRLAMAKEICATVTAPLNKEALHMAGYNYSGHTEIYAALTKTPHYSMMLADGRLKVVHVSTHVSLRQACDLCKKERVLNTIRLAYNACRDLGIETPRIAVAGLNPHAGENGLFGTEEQEQILPAVMQAQAEGICAVGPLPPDTVFCKVNGGLYDIAVAQYHDQGHIPLKTMGFVMRDDNTWKSVSGVNITLGLPIIRTSVDHGTAFDQAGNGTANEESMMNAIEYAARLAEVKQRKEMTGD